MDQKEMGLGQAAEQWKDNKTIRQLLAGKDTRRMMELLNRQGGVRQAAWAAAAGDTSGLIDMMNKLMASPEGAEVVERVTRQAKQSGL